VKSGFDFGGKKVLVVGGSSGIGNGVAQAFRRDGADVHVWGTRDSARSYEGEPGSNLSGLGYSHVNVAHANAIEAAPAPFDSLDVLVLSQGTVASDELAPDSWDRVMSVNLDSLVHCSRKFYPLLKQTHGAIIIIASVAAFHPTPNHPAYCASKAGAASLVRTLGQSWAPAGIRVNGLAPGFVDTKLARSAGGVDLEALRQSIPVGRLGTPADMAGIVQFLASPLAHYIIGQTLMADGGLFS
jgi:3-oxoacyl-[acyl-carrier protein] reductase